MEIRDTIQSDDIRCDGWIDKDTAEASIRQTEATQTLHAGLRRPMQGISAWRRTIPRLHFR